MASFLFHTVLYNPFYNGLIFLISIIPRGDVGVAVILLTIVVKLALFSLSYKSIQTQIKIKELEPALRAIKEKHKDDKQEQALKTMALYKEKKVNPFSSFLVILIQIPVILALYLVFSRGGLPTINHAILYSFIPAPAVISTRFLGLIDIFHKSLILAVLAGVSQFFQAKLLIPAREKQPPGSASSLGDDFAHSMQLQMKYVLPAMIGFIAYRLAAAVALYWTVSNVFAIGQEMFVGRRMRMRKVRASVRSKLKNQNVK